MKCELCRTEVTESKRLCRDCGEMIGRLVMVDRRMHSREVCEAERLAERSGAHHAASSRG